MKERTSLYSSSEIEWIKLQSKMKSNLSKGPCTYRGAGSGPFLLDGFTG